MKQVFVFFPYVWSGNLHPWMNSQIKAFKKADFRVRVYPQKKNKIFLINLLKLFLNLPKIINWIRQSDYILLSSCFFASFYTLFIKSWQKKIILAHISTLVYPSEKTPFLKPFQFLNKFLRNFDALSFKSCDYLFTYAYSIANDLQKAYNLKKEKIYVIETLVDTKIFTPRYKKESLMIKEKLGLVKKDILLYHGRLHPWHGLKYFFEAVPRLLKKNPNFAFVILGTEKKGLEPFIPKKILNNPHFYFPGRLEKHQDLPKYIQIADLWFGRFAKAPFPSLGHCVVEAMACAKPVILYKTGEHTRLLTDKKEAIFVGKDNPQDIYEKISFYFKNKKNKEKLVMIGKNARRTALEKFSVAAFSKKLKKILN